MRDFLTVTGATTTGKTSVSVAVAEALGGEIISMDSRQVYRGMDIATDKIRPPLLGTVPHHGLDLREPNERYSAGMYARDARGWIDGIRERGRVPLLVGGTGFFLKALIDPIFAEPAFDPDHRDRLRAYLEAQPTERLQGWVRRLDPERAELAIEGGPHRLQRTLEVAILSGRPLTWWHKHAEVEAPARSSVIVVLELPREELDRRINARVDRMLERGLLDEVRTLMEAGFGPGDPGMTGTGYRELRAHLLGEMELEEALESMRSQTRKYARRQITWFRHQLPDDVRRLDADRPKDELVAAVIQAWRAG
jgi:tRNA dimethylallyltransferase